MASLGKSATFMAEAWNRLLYLVAAMVKINSSIEPGKVRPMHKNCSNPEMIINIKAL
jgi:hypothetical protein